MSHIRDNPGAAGLNRDAPSGTTAPGSELPPGIIVIDKPRGPSSHQVTAWAGEILGTHVGHSGTLDPQVSGVLLVMTGRAVRLAPLLLRHEKEYVCLVRLHADVPRGRIDEVMQEFVGKIYQRPPRKSAVARNLRIRTIHSIEVLDVEGRLVLFRVSCDAGTYIRSLCHHIGLVLGTGAHMQELRRTRSGPFTETDACTLQDLTDAVVAWKDGNPAFLEERIRPIHEAVKDYPSIVIRDSAVDAISRGAALAGVGVISRSAFGKRDPVVIKTQSGDLVSIGEAILDSEKVLPGKTGLVAAPRITFMHPGAYPRGWTSHREEKGGKKGT